MAEVLVLVDHVDGAVRKTTLELLTIARRLGEPAAVFLGRGADLATATLADHGAVKIYVVDAPEIDSYLVTPKADALDPDRAGRRTGGDPGHAPPRRARRSLPVPLCGSAPD